MANNWVDPDPEPTPTKKRRWWVWAIGIVLLLAFCGDDNDKSRYCYTFGTEPDTRRACFEERLPDNVSCRFVGEDGVECSSPQ